MSNKPNIIVSSDDYEKLHEMLDRMPHDDSVERLINELERAEVIDTLSMPDSVVTMNSTVNFTVLQTRKSFTYKLVYPRDKLQGDSLSILTPVGSALLGLSIGQDIEWSFDNGRTTSVRIDSISSDIKENIVPAT